LTPDKSVTPVLCTGVHEKIHICLFRNFVDIFPKFQAENVDFIENVNFLIERRAGETRVCGFGPARERHKTSASFTHSTASGATTTLHHHHHLLPTTPPTTSTCITHPHPPHPSAHTDANVCARRRQQAPSHNLCWRPAPHTIFLCVHAGTTTARRQSPPARPRASESATSTTPSTLQTWRNDVHHSLGGSFRSCPGECRTLFQHTHDTHRKLPSRTRSLYTIPPTLARVQLP
jgi:hypothetical protein